MEKTNMNKAVILLTAVILCGISLDAQRGETMQVGAATFWLGMSEEQAHGALQPAMSLSWVGDGMIESAKGPPFEMYGQVAITKGRVAFISKEWLLNATPDTQIGLASAIYGAFASMTNGNEMDCHVSSYTQKEPAYEEEGVDVTCPEGGVIRSVGITNYRTNVEVQERLATLDHWKLRNQP